MPFVSMPFVFNVKQGTGAVGGVGGEDDEADPLDAFMTGLQAPSVTQARWSKQQEEQQAVIEIGTTIAAPKRTHRACLLFLVVLGACMQYLYFGLGIGVG